jgi:hypothetical protein
MYVGVLVQGPLQSLTVDRVAWKSKARASSSGGDAADSSSDADTPAAAGWLPVCISGVTVVIGRHAPSTSKRKRKAGKPQTGRNAAAVAAARPAVTTVLAIARRLLPGVPITVQDVTVKLKV